MCDIMTSPKQRKFRKEKIKMTRDYRRVNEDNMNPINENCNCSPYTMATIAGCLLLCIGIIVYALIGA
jgi:hypothetical protein